MAKQLLERRVAEEKQAVTVKLPKTSVAVLDAYAEWVNYERADVLAALIGTLLDDREFSQHYNNGSNGRK